MPKENLNHPDDHQAIERLHQQYVGKIERISDELMTFQDSAYAMGLDRGKQLAARQDVTLQHARANRVYVAGPMTGIDDFNYPAFNAVAERLRAQGYEVENPAEHGTVEGAQWADYMAYDLTRLGLCGAIYLLPGWSNSKGAKIEKGIAVTLGMDIRLDPNAEQVDESVPPAPPEQTSDRREILGRPNFTCHFIAKALRLMGFDIPQKSEEEQAVTIYWMLGHYLRDPVNWRDAASTELKSNAPKPEAV
jgi:hypothetical protein